MTDKVFPQPKFRKKYSRSGFPLQHVMRTADTRSVMLFIVALLVWFALSIPASLIIGRMLGAAPSDRRVPAPERRRPTYGDGLVRS